MIPHILWQTAQTIEDITANPHRAFVKSWMVANPTFDSRFMDDNDCRNFIKDNFSDEVFSVYNALPLGIMRADMWRIAVVYVNGGIYADTDVFCMKSIAPLLSNKDLILCHEHHDTELVSNFFFAATPKHPVLKEVLELMVTSFNIAFDTESNMLVQNFGMNTLQKICNKYHVDLITKEQVDSYVTHHCCGTWRESEENYRNSRFMKPITFFTTFNQNGYDLYGKIWIKTFIENVACKSPNIRAIVYAHDIVGIQVDHPQIEIVDYDTALPQHSKWKADFLEVASGYSKYVRDSAIRFSHKGFVISDALDRITTGYAIWLDGDCVMHDAAYDTFPSDLLQTTAIACQLEHARPNAHHIESGILLFDMDNTDIEKFKKQFKFNYEIAQVITMPEPYDGFIVYRSIVDSEIPFNDLNEKYGIGGIQSCPTLTFLHPEVASRFTHNIGLTGKSNYDDWDDIKYKDAVFSQLADLPLLTPHQMKIRNLQAKKKLITK